MWTNEHHVHVREGVHCSSEEPHRSWELGGFDVGQLRPVLPVAGHIACCEPWSDFLSPLCPSGESEVSLRATEASLPQVCLCWRAEAQYKSMDIRATQASGFWILCFLGPGERIFAKQWGRQILESNLLKVHRLEFIG